MTLRHSTKNSYQLLLSIMKLHMIQIGQKIIQHRYRFNDSDTGDDSDESDDAENYENDENNEHEEHDNDENIDHIEIG